MPQCKFCDDKTDFEWFEDFQGKWKLGTKLDINNYRKHTCKPKQETSNKRNWIQFVCESCGCDVRRNMQLVKGLNVCLDCEVC